MYNVISSDCDQTPGSTHLDRLDRGDLDLIGFRNPTMAFNRLMAFAEPPCFAEPHGFRKDFTPVNPF